MNQQPSIVNNQSSIVNIPPFPWFPPALLARIAESGPIEYEGRMPRPVRKIMRKPRRVKASKWAQEHFTVVQSRIPGPWRNETLPYLPDILDAAQLPFVETIIICKAPQVGLTEAVNAFLAYTIDCAPGPVLCVYPDEVTARDNSKDRIQPAIKESARLRTYLTGSDDDVASLRIKLSHVLIYLAWARSAARLANRPIRYLVFDEVDKYPDTAGKREADPISLGEKRATTYHGVRKIFKFSSPTIESGPIWQAFTTEAEVIFDYWVQCPQCKKELLMTDEQIRVDPPDLRDPQKIKGKKLAYYECPHCSAHWDDDQRDRAVARGHWKARPFGWQEPASNWKKQTTDYGQQTTDNGQQTIELFKYLRKHRPAAIAFHAPAWISRFVSLSEVLADFFEADAELKKTRKKTKLKDYCNARKAEPWIEYEIERQEDAIIALCDDRPRGLVPGSGIIAGLTGAVDTQDNGFYFEIRAWGWGLDEESWQIREGFVPNFSALEQVLFDDRYKDEDGNQLFVKFTVIDAMGHRTKEVYSWCAQHRGRVIPFKGEQRMQTPYSYTNLIKYPGTNKQIPGGLKLLRADVNFYKNDLSAKLQIAPADPGAYHMHSEMSLDWAQQMCAEYVNDKGLWECPPSRANHAWDVSVYGLVCADIIGIKHWDRPKEAAEDARKARRVIDKGVRPWLTKRDRWLK